MAQTLYLDSNNSLLKIQTLKWQLSTLDSLIKYYIILNLILNINLFEIKLLLKSFIYIIHEQICLCQIQFFGIAPKYPQT